MTRFLLTAITLASLFAPAAACDGIAFSTGSCYSAAVVAPSYAYAAPIVQQQVYAAPVQAYVPQAQYYAAPARVEIVKPEVRLQLSQVQAYAYAAPQVVVQKQFAVKQYAGPLVQKQVVVKQPVVVQQRARLFGGRSVQRSFSRSVIRN